MFENPWHCVEDNEKHEARGSGGLFEVKSSHRILGSPARAVMENPADWRSAVDPTTGRTYWYHRKTRVSTWTKPDFMEVHSDAPQSSASISESKPSTASNSLQAIASSAPPAKQQQMPQPLPAAVQVEAGPISSKTNAQANHNEYDISTTKSAKSSNTTEFRFQRSNNDQNNVEELRRLQQSIDERALGMIRKSPIIISDLVDFLAISRHRNSRIQALTLLWRLSANRLLASTAFQSNQVWTNLWAAIDRWEDHESFILLAASFCNLSIGPTYDLIPLEAIEQLCGKAMFLLDSLLSLDKKLNTSITLTLEEVQDLVNDLPIKWYSLMAQKGHVLPALVLLILASQALR